MPNRPLIISVMTPFPHTVDIEATLSEVRQFLRENHIHHLPVTEHDKLVGVVSDRDIKLCLGPDFDYPDENEITVNDIVIRDAYVVDITCPLDEVLAAMAERRCGCALVTRHEKPVGIFTCVDACRSYSNELRKRFAVDVDDSVA
jgi:acetoin utilization protein AcuB